MLQHQNRSQNWIRTGTVEVMKGNVLTDCEYIVETLPRLQLRCVYLSSLILSPVRWSSSPFGRCVSQSKRLASTVAFGKHINSWLRYINLLLPVTTQQIGKQNLKGLVCGHTPLLLCLSHHVQCVKLLYNFDIYIFLEFSVDFVKREPVTRSLVQNIVTYSRKQYSQLLKHKREYFFFEKIELHAIRAV